MRMCIAICSNKLTDLPDELAELQHLRVLRVKYNSLTKLPEVLVKMNKLEILELSGNQITAVDDKVLAGLVNVRYLPFLLQETLYIAADCSLSLNSSVLIPSCHNSV